MFKQNYNQDIRTMERSRKPCLFAWKNSSSFSSADFDSGAFFPASTKIRMVHPGDIYSDFVVPMDDLEYIFKTKSVFSDDFVMNWYQLIKYPTYTRLDGLIVRVGLEAIYQFKNPGFLSLYGFNMIAIAFGLFVFSTIIPGSNLF